VDGAVVATVEPLLVSPGTTLARVRDEQNQVEVHSGWSAPLTASGPGAGGLPTATALLSDFLCTGRVPHRHAAVHGGRVDSRLGEWALEVTGAPALLHRTVPGCGLVQTDDRARSAWTLVRQATSAEMDALLLVLASRGGDPIAVRFDDEDDGASGAVS
jgi:hypothetical protein